MSTYDLSIVIPCFNESKNVSIVLQQISQLILKRKEKIEVIVVDGASTDNTPQELKHFFKTTLNSNHFKLILKHSRGGYGQDIMSAVKKAQGKVIAWTHADMQTDPNDVLLAYDKYNVLKKHYSHVFIKGQRKKRRLLEVFFTFGMQIITFIALKKNLNDINAQPKLFSKDFYEKHLKEEYPHDFSLDLFALYKAKTNKVHIDTIPVYFKARIHGEAKGGGGSWKMRIKLIRRTFKYIFNLKKQINKNT